MGSFIQLAIGCFTDVEDHTPYACGKGIRIISFDEDRGIWGNSTLLEGHKNPSYLDWDHEKRILYAIADSSDEKGEILIYKSDLNQRLYLDSSVSGPGLAACHLKGDFKNHKIYAVSYGDGTANAYNLDKGIPTDPCQFFHFEGTGPNRERQVHSHVHQVMFDNQSPYFYICDLGSDRIWMNRRRGGKTSFDVALKVPYGYGPRHLAFDPSGQYAFILCELIPRILLVRFKSSDGTMQIVQDLPTVDSSLTDLTAPAAVKVHPSGKTVALSNRFDDSITVFKIKRQGEKVSLEFYLNFSSKGKTPREITFTPKGKWLLIANQDSSDIQVKAFDSESGLPLNEWSMPLNSSTPVCVLPLI